MKSVLSIISWILPRSCMGVTLVRNLVIAVVLFWNPKFVLLISTCVIKSPIVMFTLIWYLCLPVLL